MRRPFTRLNRKQFVKRYVALGYSPAEALKKFKQRGGKK